MLLTVKVELPALVIVNVAVAVPPVLTVPKVKLPLNPIIFVRTTPAAMPAPEAALVPLPLVASLVTVTVPL